MGDRSLAHVELISELRGIPGYDRVEVAHVLGWTVMVKKDQFKPGDKAVYIEIDSLVPEKPPFEFMEKYGYKVKTQKFCKGAVLSQGLLMTLDDVGLPLNLEVGTDVTDQLGITYYDPDDVARKEPSEDKYKKMAKRQGKLFAHQPFRWLMRREWGRKLLFLFFGNTADRKRGWPEWVTKTDEIRIQQIPQVVEDKQFWFVTEKIDGTSTTFTMKRNGKKFDYRVCSRNMCLDPDNNNNVYVEMALKYDVESVLKKILVTYPDLSFVTIQGETYGSGILKRQYIKDHDFAAFNVIFGYPTGKKVRFNPAEGRNILKPYGIPFVPILDESYILPDTVEEALAYADAPSVIDGNMREGVVLRDYVGEKSFKVVSNEYLLKYH